MVTVERSTLWCCKAAQPSVARSDSHLRKRHQLCFRIERTTLPDVWEGYFKGPVILGASFRPTDEPSVGVCGRISCTEFE